ncbi:uncharacterized protein JCM10292_000934 [Rhodotorula paludigena]|uniref:uncharacterized protein n=1 Tax=Rhodotorula paludigena TaxID=86838 RepID=UPI00317AB9D1
MDEWRTARATVRVDAPSSSSTSSPPIAASTPLRRILPRRSPETEQTLSSTLLRHIPLDGPASFVRPSLFPIFDSEDDATHLGYFVAGNVALRLNTFASTLPPFDSFKHRVIPYFSHNIAERRGDDADPADIKVLYHAAIRFSALHRAQTDTDTGRLYDTAAEHAQWAVEALEALPTKYSRSERLLLARVLLVLGNIVAGEPVEVSPSDLVANVTTPVGHDLYDVGCVWRTLTLCLREDKGVCTPVPLAGDRDLELTYGLSRRIWHILSRVNDLCSHARMLWSALGDTAAGLLAIEAQQLLQEAEEVTRLAEADETPRIRKGTEVGLSFTCPQIPSSRPRN